MEAGHTKQAERCMDLACRPEFAHHQHRILCFTKAFCMSKCASFASEINLLKQVGKETTNPILQRRKPGGLSKVLRIIVNKKQTWILTFSPQNSTALLLYLFHLYDKS